MQVDEFTRPSSEHPERNEDAYLILTGDDNQAPVFAVIDGMGGHKHSDSEGNLITGHEAAQTIRRVFEEVLSGLPAELSSDEGELAEDRLMMALEEANAQVFDKLNEGQNSHDKRVGAVATVAILCDNGSQLLLAQIGDTRAYLQTGDSFKQVLEDEDNVSYLVQSGIMSEEDGQKIAEILDYFDGINEPQSEEKVYIYGQEYALSEAWRWFLEGNPSLKIPGANVVVSALGINEECPYPQIACRPINKGDSLFLLSDGIYKNLSLPELRKHLNENQLSAKILGEASFARSQDSFNRRSNVDDMTAIHIKFD